MCPGISLVSAENFAQWQMDIQVLDDNPIYRGKIFRLNFKFNGNYPIEAPEVIFVRAADRGTYFFSLLSLPIIRNIFSDLSSTFVCKYITLS